ncbi:hypothetical protein O77CONTIG1_04653 [Leptolyngbya sp. O-77]|nr:hypothetical protein O77CONTIG1_04653 [Leptolyngbya sp. O-77]
MGKNPEGTFHKVFPFDGESLRRGLIPKAEIATPKPAPVSYFVLLLRLLRRVQIKNHILFQIKNVVVVKNE